MTYGIHKQKLNQKLSLIELKFYWPVDRFLISSLFTDFRFEVLAYYIVGENVLTYCRWNLKFLRQMNYTHT
jgi:hypothetical protein